MRIIKLLLLITFVIVIENIWTSIYKPDLFLLLVITYCVYKPTEKGVFLSFGVGFTSSLTW